MKQEKRRERRYFIFTFATAFLFFSLLFLSMMVLVHPDAGQAARFADRDLNEDYAPEAGDALTVLFFGARTREEIPGAYVLARFDPAGGQVPVLVLPPETAVLNGGGPEPISEVYRYGGAGYTRDALARTMGIAIDRYVRMDYAAFLTAADAVGAVEFQLREAAVLEQDGLTIQLNEGRQLLDGSKVGAVLAAPGGGIESALERSARLVAEIVNQRMDIALSAVADNIFEKIVNKVDTDISYVDYHERKQAAAWLAERKGSPAFGMVPTGSWDSGRTLFTLSDTFLADAALKFG